MNTLKNKGKLVILLVLGLAFTQAFAQYTISKHTINNGGEKMTGGLYEMNSSIGQVDASNRMSNGNYSVTGGFWHENVDLIYKNNFENNF